MATEDTEITLGAGKMLGLFFGLVILCALFFSLGFSVGRNSAKPTPLETFTVPATSNSGVRPTAAKPSNATPSDLTFYKAVEQKDPNAQLTTPEAVDNPKDVNTLPASPVKPDTDASPAQTPAPASATPVAASTPNGYYVQVAAVTKREDADALVDALKKKQYPAFSSSSSADKFIHVQVGPFTDIKDAEMTRGKLVADGYNPIVKK